MIPPLKSGVLPPFLPGQPIGHSSSHAPYPCSLTELVKEFGFSQDRLYILEGLINFREQLRKAGITEGWQWIDGSFVEDIEARKGRSPGDIDVVTFATNPPFTSSAQEQQFMHANWNLFDRVQSKVHYKCDSFLVPFNWNPELLIYMSKFWYGLFSHQRDTYLWKGMLHIDLNSDDNQAMAIIQANLP